MTSHSPKSAHVCFFSHQGGESVSLPLEYGLTWGYAVTPWVLRKESGFPDSGLKRPYNFCFNFCNSVTPHEKAQTVLLERMRDHLVVSWGEASVFQQTARTVPILDPSAQPCPANSQMKPHEWVPPTPGETETSCTTQPCTNSWPTESWAIKGWFF